MCIANDGVQVLERKRNAGDGAGVGNSNAEEERGEKRGEGEDQRGPLQIRRMICAC